MAGDTQAPVFNPGDRDATPRFSKDSGETSTDLLPGPACEEGTPHRLAGAAASHGDRFRVLRLHASGGLGAVFVARDSALNRDVALKQIREHHADDPSSRSRFLREAEITGGLEHPGIVPVYALGEDKDGRPYYAMRLIQGDDLAAEIARYHAAGPVAADPGERSLALRKLLRRLQDACNAVEYAHRRGVIHRDLKPSNIMAGRYGETLVVDWGLAKCIDRGETGGPPDEPRLAPASGGGSSETVAGSAIGTPAYMSPEQASGDLDRIGPASDVYSLGAALYCILTGKPPFFGSNKDEVLKAVEDGEFPAPRALDPSIPPALEAICLKAMSRDPGDRYASPRALGDDLERWMADEPVGAYRDPWTTRARRWLRRHQAAATAGGSLASIAVIGIMALSLISAARAREALKAKEAEQYRKEALQKEADSYMTYALHVANLYKTDANTSSPSINGAVIQGLLTALERRDQDPEAAAQAARAVRDAFQWSAEDEAKSRAADFEIVVGKLRRGIDVMEKVRREFPERESYRAFLGRYYLLFAVAQTRPVTDLAGYEAMLSGRGVLDLRKRSELEATLALYDKAAAFLPPDGEGVRLDWYLTWMGRGTVLVQLGRFSESLMAFDQARGFAEGPQWALVHSLLSLVLKGAEVEQSHMPWSRPPTVDHAKAMQMAEALVAREGVNPAAVYNAACAFSLASLDPSASADECSRRADRAMAYLRRIAAQGYFKSRPQGLLGLFSGKDTLKELRTDHDLDPIRLRPDFRKLLTDLESPAAPNAR